MTLEEKNAERHVEGLQIENALDDVLDEALEANCAWMPPSTLQSLVVLLMTYREAMEQLEVWADEQREGESTVRGAVEEFAFDDRDLDVRVQECIQRAIDDGYLTERDSLIGRNPNWRAALIHEGGN